MKLYDSMNKMTFEQKESFYPAPRYAQILDGMNEGCQLISPDWRYLYVNNAAAAHGNQTRENLLGAKMTDIYPGIEQTDAFHAMRGCMEQKVSRTMESEFTFSDGSKRWFNLNIQPMSEGILVTSVDITARKQARGDLEQIFTMSMDMLCIADIYTATFKRVNPAFTETLGYSKDELLGQSFFSFIHPEDIDATRSIMEKKLQQGEKVINFENRYKGKDGTYHWLSWVSHPNIDDGVTFAVARDITLQKQQEDELRRNKQLLDATGRMARVGGWELDARTMDVIWTEETYRIHDVPIGERPSLADAINFFHPDDQQKLSAAIAHALEHGEPYDMEVRLITAKGNHLWTHTMCRPQLEDGKVVKLHGTFQDVTERKRTEDALLDRENMLTRFSSQVPGMLYQFLMAPDGAFSVPYSSDGVMEIFGCSPDDVRDDFEPIFNAIHPDDRSKILHTIDLSIKNLSQWKCEYRVQIPGRPLKWVYGNSFPEKRADGSILWSGYNVEITERKLAEEERARLETHLRQAQKMESVGRLAGGVAHDFNNMLGVILGHADMAMDKLAPHSEVISDLEKIRNAGERSANLTRQLLAFARKQTIAPKVLNINNTVKDMISMLKRLIGEDIDLMWTPGAEVWTVRMDPSQIDQVLANLCVNARDAIVDVGKITIETDNVCFDSAYCTDHPGFLPGEYVLLAVSDNGCGMEADMLSNIFEPFFTTRGKEGGTGLGLATVYGVVKQNNGFLKVYSEPGKGTTFRIYLPRHAPEADGQSERAKPLIAERGNETILLVEDQPDILAMAKAMLKSLGYHILAAATPGEAIRIAEQYDAEVHLILTDVVMPEMNGRDLNSVLVSIFPDIKCLFMSGYTANVIAHHGVLDEGVNFIQKPFSKVQLGIKVRETLDQGSKDL